MNPQHPDHHDTEHHDTGHHDTGHQASSRDTEPRDTEPRDTDRLGVSGSQSDTRGDARVIPFPAPVEGDEHPGGGVVDRAGEVLEGELIGEGRERAVVGAVAGQVTRLEVARRRTVWVITTARAVATHDRTRALTLGVTRHGWLLVAGAGVVIARWRDTHGTARYERMMRQAELVGDREALWEWEARDVAEKARRHNRVMDWVGAPVALVKALATGALAVAGLLLALGVVLAVAHSDLSEVLAPVLAVARAIAVGVWVLTAYGAVLLTLGTGGGIAYLWALGRARTDPPTWCTATTTDAAVREVVPDEGAILAALRNLNCPELTRKFKQGWTPRWVLGTGRDGKGWRTQLELPQGVTVAMINDRRAVLAHNLVRLPVEVWPTEPKRQPGVLDLWVADQGLLTGPVDPYPLLTQGTTDYFVGVPVGIDQRGTTVVGRLMAANYAAAGVMGSGKTGLVLNLLLGAMLDPLVDIEAYVMAYNVDYDPLTPRLSVLVKGDEDTHVSAAIDALRTLRSKVTERGKVLAELGGEETKLTRDLAERDPRMQPMVVVFDECQELFRHEKHGAEAKELAIKVMSKARKCGITLIFVTPEPSADSLPRELAKLMSHRVCFAVGDHQANDAVLGTGAHKRGITATNLVPYEDVGTAMASGFGPLPGLLRMFYVRREKGIDQVTPIVHRALALREQAGITTTPATAIPGTEPDPLTDIAAVLAQAGAERMRTQEVLSRLAERNRAHYGHWTFTDLRDALPEGAKPYKTAGVQQVAADRITDALTHHNPPDDDTHSHHEDDNGDGDD